MSMLRSTSYSWRHRSHSITSPEDASKGLFPDSESAYLAMSIATPSEETTTGRDRNDPTETTHESLLNRPESSKATMHGTSLLELLSTVPCNDADEDESHRSSPTSVTIDMGLDAPKPTDTTATLVASVHSETVTEEEEKKDEFPLEAEPSVEMARGSEQSDDSVDDDDDFAEEHILDTSSTRKSMQIAALELALERAHAQRTKMVANIQKKKQLLVNSHKKQNTMEAELAELKQTVSKLSHENVALQSGLAKVTVVRDELRNKLRIKQDVLKETRAEKDDVEKKLKRSEQSRLLEQELLNNYRRLAIHTGYYKWGKEIRQLEAALEKANTE